MFQRTKRRRRFAGHISRRRQACRDKNLTDFSDLLPHSFGPLNLDRAVTVPLLLEPTSNLIALCSPQLVTFHVSHRTRTRRPWKITAVAFNAMLDRALEKANVACAPYSTSPAGLAFGTYEGNILRKTSGKRRFQSITEPTSYRPSCIRAIECRLTT